MRRKLQQTLAHLALAIPLSLLILGSPALVVADSGCCELRGALRTDCRAQVERANCETQGGYFFPDSFSDQRISCERTGLFSVGCATNLCAVGWIKENWRWRYRREDERYGYDPQTGRSGNVCACLLRPGTAGLSWAFVTLGEASSVQGSTLVPARCRSAYGESSGCDACQY